MKIFAISDLHLSHTGDKAMDIFGRHWNNHWQKIRQDWMEKVTPEDVVLVAGDISWAMHLEEALPDLAAIGELPGRKIMIKGNHDYWHNSLQKTRDSLPEGMYFLQNDCIRLGDVVFAGSRGWRQRDDSYTERDEKLYARELERMRLSLEKAGKMGDRIFVLTHYPPFDQKRGQTPMTDLLARFGVDTVVYGHVHGAPLRLLDFSDMEMDGVRYVMTSCDYTGFRLREL